MFQIITAFLLGVVSIISPCVLPAIPLLVAASMGKIRNLALLFLGMVLNMILLGILSGFLALTPLRFLAYAFMAIFALILLSEKVESLSLKFSSKISNKAYRVSSGSSFLFGFFLAYIWFPCISPFFGLALSTAMLTDPSMGLIVMLSYSAGIMFSIALVLGVGRRIFKIKIRAPVKKLTGALILVYLILFATGAFERIMNLLHTLTR